jgi:hypothetical protein
MFYTEGLQKVLPGIDPGKTLPGKNSLLAQYYPKIENCESKKVIKKFGLQHRRGPGGVS